MVTRGGWGVAAGGSGVSFWDDENILELDGGDGCTTYELYLKK